MTLKFLLEGLNNREKVAYFLHSHTEEQITDAFKKIGIDIKTYIRSGQFSFIHATDVYVINGTFDPDETIRRLREATIEATEKQGFTKYRVTGEVGWANQLSLAHKVLPPLIS